MTRLKLKKNIKKKILNILLLLFIIIFILSTFKVIISYYQDYKSNNLYTKIIDEYVETKNKEDVIDFKKLKSINEDIVGWIKVSDTNINYPIVKGSSDSYYLRRDIEKKHNQNGSIFMHYKNSRDFSDNNTILFGHNSNRNSLMFSDLRKLYDDKDKKDIKIYIYTQTEELIFDVYSIYLIDSTDFSILDINKNWFDKSERDFGIDKKDGRTITLSTCYKDSTKRIIVHGIEESLDEKN